MNEARKHIAWTIAGAIGTSTLFVAAVVAVLIYFDLQNAVIDLLNWLDGQGIVAPLLFALVMAVVVVLLLPGILLTTGAGFVFGIVTGTISVVVGTTLGATVAFLVARGTFGKRAARYVLNNPKLHGLEKQLSPHAWKIVCATRFIPFFPAKLANYFFGLTSVSPGAFVGGSLIGFVPLSLHNAYLGAFAAELTVEGLRTSEFGEGQWITYGCGFVLVVLAVAYLARRGWRAVYADTARAGSRVPSG